jgi:hypothetical protein
VTVFDGTNQIGTTTANGSGAWGFTSGILPNGNHNFTAEAADGTRMVWNETSGGSLRRAVFSRFKS